MRPIAELRGLRFPDVFVVRMFFKEGLHRKPGRVLELGCGNGNNLAVFSEFGWDVTGVDISAGSLDDARYNLPGAGTWIESDLAANFPIPADAVFDAILLPNLGYYLPRRSFVRILQECGKRIRPGGVLFLSMRLPEDWRFGRGKEEEPGGFRIDYHSTGEFGLLNVFYTAEEVSALVAEHFGQLADERQLRVTYDNPQDDSIIRNAEVIMWGRAAAQ